MEAVEGILTSGKDLSGLKVLVTAGATRERLDPVRFITNDSSGKMGFALAEAARDRGAEVTVVRACVTAPVPDGVRIISVESAMDLYDAMMREAPENDIVIQAAAVSDYRPAEFSAKKIKKDEGREMVLHLVENPDIAAAVGKNKKTGQTLVGFAAETDRVLEHAQDKLARKNLDMIVANDVTQEGAGFNVDTNIAAIITRDGIDRQPLQAKRQLAEEILDRVVALRKKA